MNSKIVMAIFGIAVLCFGLGIAVVKLYEADRVFTKKQAGIPVTVAEKIVESLKPCADELDTAILRQLREIADNSFDDEATVRGKIRRSECIRKWAITLKDPCAKSDYINWLDFYDKYNQGHLDELRTHVQENEQRDHERKRQEEQRKVATYIAEHHIPKPPQCDIEAK